MMSAGRRSALVAWDLHSFRNRLTAGNTLPHLQIRSDSATCHASTFTGGWTPRLHQGLLGVVVHAGLCLAGCRRALRLGTSHRRGRRLSSGERGARKQQHPSCLELQRKWGTHSLTPGDLRQLQRGHSVLKQERDGPAGSGFAVLEVDAPKAIILDCLERFEDYPGMIPVVRQSELLFRTPSSDGTTSAHVNYKVSRFWLSVSVQHTVDIQGGTVWFSRDPSSSRAVLEEASGFWQVEQAPGGHPGRSRVWLRVGLRASSILPHWIVDWASRRALRRASSWLRPHTERLWRERRVSLLWRDERKGGAQVAVRVPPAQRLRPSAA